MNLCGLTVFFPLVFCPLVLWRENYSKRIAHKLLLPVESGHTRAVTQPQSWESPNAATSEETPDHLASLQI